MADAKRLPDGRASTAIRLDAENYEGMKKAAEGFGLPMNFLINQAIREFLAHMIDPKDFKLTRDPSH